MTKNIGNLDKIIRLIIGISLLGFSIYSKSAVLAIFGLFSIYEAVSGWCIFYQIIGRNTCPIKNKKDDKIPFLQIFITGASILIGAIILNIFAVFLGIPTWYDLLKNFDKTVNEIKIDEILFLILIYPFSLGFIAYLINRLFTKFKLK